MFGRWIVFDHLRKVRQTEELGVERAQITPLLAHKALDAPRVVDFVADALALHAKHTAPAHYARFVLGHTKSTHRKLASNQTQCQPHSDVRKKKKKKKKKKSKTET